MCVCLSVCLCDRSRTQSLNQLTDLVQIRYIGSSCSLNISSRFFTFPPTPKIKSSSHKKKFKSSNFSKIALTIFIKFCGLMVHSKPNNMIPANLPGKIPVTAKIFLNFFSSPNAGLKPSLQSRSNSIYRILLQIFLATIFVFYLPLKLRVVHITKNYKISILSKMAPTKLIKFCRFTLHSKPNNVTLSAFPEKIPETKKKFNFSVRPSPNRAHNPTDQWYPISISRAPLQISPFPFFIFFLYLPLKLRVVHTSKKI